MCSEEWRVSGSRWLKASRSLSQDPARRATEGSPGIGKRGLEPRISGCRERRGLRGQLGDPGSSGRFSVTSRECGSLHVFLENFLL